MSLYFGSSKIDQGAQDIPQIVKDNIEKTYIITNNINWNDITNSGIYKVQGATMTAEYNAPDAESENGILQVLKSGIQTDNRTVQIYYPQNPIYSKIWTRMKNDTVWSIWNPTNTDDSKLVHKTGDETISGSKTFSTQPKYNESNLLVLNDIYKYGTFKIGGLGATPSNSVLLGNSTYSINGGSDTNCIAIGSSSSTISNSIALGASAQAHAINNIQIGNGTNYNQNTLQVNSYTLLDTSTGLIPKERLAMALHNKVGNCILEAPNGVFTVSGRVVTIKAGLKVLLASGLNADGSPRNVEYTVPSDKQLTVSGNSSCINIFMGTESLHWYSYNDYFITNIIPNRDNYMRFDSQNNLFYECPYQAGTGNEHEMVLVHLGKIYFDD